MVKFKLLQQSLLVIAFCSCIFLSNCDMGISLGGDYSPIIPYMPQPIDSLENVKTQDSLFNLVSNNYEMFCFEQFENDSTLSYYHSINIERIEDDLLKLTLVDTVDMQYPSPLNLYFRRRENWTDRDLHFDLDTINESQFETYLVDDINPDLIVGEDTNQLLSRIHVHFSGRVTVNFHVFTFIKVDTTEVYRSSVAFWN